MDSSLDRVDYEAISSDPFLLVTHLNRTTPSALFNSQWSESCCIYHWPAINASSGRLVINNGSRSKEPPLWSRRHWREVYLAGRIDQHAVFFLDLFIYLRSVQEKKEDNQFPRSAFHRLNICLWLVGEDVQCQTLDCSEPFGENCSAPIEL